MECRTVPPPLAWPAGPRPDRTPNVCRVFLRLGVNERSLANRAAAESHYELLHRTDGGRAYLAISRGWCDPAAETALRSGLGSRAYPAQVIWGEHDPVLRARNRVFVETILQPERSLTVNATHFLQEDLPTELSAEIASFCLQRAADTPFTDGRINA